MAGELSKGRVDPVYARLGDLKDRVEKATGERPMFGRRMSPAEYERLMLKSIAQGKLDPAIRPGRKTNEIVVD